MVPAASFNSKAIRIQTHLALAASLVTAAAGASFIRYTSWRPNLAAPLCPIHRYTGLLCPGCGATHALAALAHGKWSTAFHFNPLFVTLLPAFAAWTAIAAYRASRGHPQVWPTLPRPAIPLLYATTFAFTIIRNLPQ